MQLFVLLLGGKRGGGTKVSGLVAAFEGGAIGGFRAATGGWVTATPAAGTESTMAQTDRR